MKRKNKAIASFYHSADAALFLSFTLFFLSVHPLFQSQAGAYTQPSSFLRHSTFLRSQRNVSEAIFLWCTVRLKQRFVERVIRHPHSRLINTCSHRLWRRLRASKLRLKCLWNLALYFRMFNPSLSFSRVFPVPSSIWPSIRISNSLYNEHNLIRLKTSNINSYFLVFEEARFTQRFLELQCAGC